MDLKCRVDHLTRDPVKFDPAWRLAVPTNANIASDG